MTAVSEMPAVDRTPLKISRKQLRALEGPSHLSRWPTAVVSIVVEGDLESGAADRLAAALERQTLPAAIRPLWLEPRAEPGNAPQLVADFALALQRATGADLQESGVAFLPGGHFLCYTEHLVPEVATEALRGAVELVDLASRADEATLDNALSQLLYRLRERRPTRRAYRVMQQLARSGHRFRVLNRDTWTLQVGQGSAQRLLRSAMPDDQCYSSRPLCEDKQTTREVLRAANLPVPDGEGVSTAEEALAAARRIGYPVVVKTRDGSMGKGVRVDLRNDGDLVAAFEAVRKHGQRLTVERFIAGRPYRLLVIDGRLLHAVRRPVPEVVGDGRATVDELIDRLNAAPNRRTNDDIGYAPFERKHDPLVLRQLLQAQSLGPRDVPVAGRVVQLGLMPVENYGPHEDVMDRIHPEVVRMAEDAAAVLELSAAGIDYISPDISEAPDQRASAINEVNLAPFITMHLAVAPGRAYIDPVLAPRMKGGKGRIPLCAITDDAPGGLAPVVAQWMGRIGPPASLADTSGVWLAGGHALPRQPDRDPVVQLLADPRVEAAVLQLDERRAVELGLPFDECDLVVLGGATTVHWRTRMLETTLLSVARRGVVAPADRIDDIAGCGLRLFIVADHDHQLPEAATGLWSPAAGLVHVREVDGGLAAFRLPHTCPPELGPWLVAVLLALGVSSARLRRLFSGAWSSGHARG